jgi:REP element-mobilizing transposase RayT
MSIPRRNSDPSHVILEDRTFFVTASIWGKRSLLQSDRAARLFVENIFDYRAQRKYRLHEFVVMPDHFHVLITVGAGMTIERAVQLIKGGFAFELGGNWDFMLRSGRRVFRRFECWMWRRTKLSVRTSGRIRSGRI